MVSMPRRPARPVSWVYWPGVSSAWDSPLNLTRFSSTTVRAGMLMPRARVSVAKTARTSPLTKSSSTMCRKAGSIPAWWAANPRMRAARHCLKRSISRSAAGMSATPASMMLAMVLASSWVVRVSRKRRHCRRAASQPAREKIKVMAGSMECACRIWMTSGLPSGRKRSAGRLMPERWDLPGWLPLRLRDRKRACWFLS